MAFVGTRTWTSSATSSVMGVVGGHAGSSSVKPVGAVPVALISHEIQFQAPVCPTVRA